jgi:mono/diheme cytochrome c family protein
MGRALAALALVLGAAALCTQASAADDRLSDAQRLGRRLFEQSCAICHTKPTLASGLYAPALSRETLGGRTEVIREVISNGTPRMPGFKHHFERGEIDAIVAYLKTVPAPQAAAAAASGQQR